MTTTTLAVPHSGWLVEGRSVANHLARENSCSSYTYNSGHSGQCFGSTPNTFKKTHTHTHTHRVSYALQI